MKKLVKLSAVFILILSSISSVNAQKVAHINLNDLLLLLPERKKAENDIQEYAKQLDGQLKTMSNEYDAKIADYQAKEALTTEPIKADKQKEIGDLEERIKAFQQTAQESLQKKQNDLLERTVADFDKAVESTYLEFPLHIKFRSARINNFAVYMLGGGKFSIHMATKKDVNNEIDDEVVVKLEKYDYSVDVGAGCDMFLPYFKFGIELKHSIGLANLAIDDGTRFSAPIESIRTKVWVLTFTFEG